MSTAGPVGDVLKAHQTLLLPEQVVLLSYIDQYEKYREWLKEPGGNSSKTIVNGSIALELMVRERIVLTQDARLEFVDTSPTGEDILDMGLSIFTAAYKSYKSGEETNLVDVLRCGSSDEMDKLHALIFARLIKRGLCTAREVQRVGLFGQNKGMETRYFHTNDLPQQMRLALRNVAASMVAKVSDESLGLASVEPLGYQRAYLLSAGMPFVMEEREDETSTLRESGQMCTLFNPLPFYVADTALSSNSLDYAADRKRVVQIQAARWRNVEELSKEFIDEGHKNGALMEISTVKSGILQIRITKDAKL